MTIYRTSVSLAVGIFFVLPAGLWHVQAGNAVNPYTSEFEKSPPKPGVINQMWLQDQTREEQQRYLKRVAIPDAVGPNVQFPGSAITARRQQEMAAQAQPRAALDDAVRQDLLLAALLILSGTLAVRKLAPEIAGRLNQQFNPWALSPGLTVNVPTKVLAEEEALSEFKAAFHAGPRAPARAFASASCSLIPESKAPIEAVENDFGMECGSLEQFLARVPEQLVVLRKMFQEISRTPQDAARREILGDIEVRIRALKGWATPPELLPVWQMASALEGLLKQLTEKVSNITPSTLRTAANGVDLLEDLCQPGLKPDLATNPPIRLLAVDDDRISRSAISYALKRLFHPDLAENGEAALALVAWKPYDVIFLDVQMPGMDGFELCAKIHGTSVNRQTPVVFVTCHSDFDARAKSTLCGGNDLIGKPFLTYEITVKALTFALRGRLQNRDQTAASPNDTDTSKPLPTSGPETVATVAVAGPVPPSSGNPASSCDLPHAPGRGTKEKAAHKMPATPGRQIRVGDSIVSTGSSPDAFAGAFLAHASADLAALRNLLQELGQTGNADARQEILVDLYLRIHSWSLNASLAGLVPAFQVSSALEALLKKLLEHPKNFTASTRQTIAAAVDLLQDLCVRELKVGLITDPPFRLLVVDDDPIARRAITGALQTAFTKPDGMESGQTALALATKKPFDVIFLDVQMPDMDGFELCSKIRETTANRATPVVFVTSHSDFKSHDQSVLSGGSDLITKPVMFIEVTVKALTFALRGRLEKLKAAPGRGPSATVNALIQTVQPCNSLVGPAAPSATLSAAVASETKT
jgi:PleD family two-component response regulator